MLSVNFLKQLFHKTPVTDARVFYFCYDFELTLIMFFFSIEFLESVIAANSSCF